MPLPAEKPRLGGPQFRGVWSLPVMPARPDTLIRLAKYGSVVLDCGFRLMPV